MKAVEARKITEESLTGPVIAPLLEIAYQRIKSAAEKGKSSVSHPFYNSYPSPSQEAVDAAVCHLKSLGYSVNYYSDPDPGDPRSSAWYEVSW